MIQYIVENARSEQTKTYRRGEEDIMAKWFYKQSILVQVILLLIPVVNWVVEVCVRWSAYMSRPKLLTLVFAILTIPLGIIFGWVDLVWLLLTGHLLFAKA